MSILLTGVAGFIGMHTAQRLLERGERIIGVDNINAYYDPALKKARIAKLREFNGFTFERLDFADLDTMRNLLDRYPNIDRVIHLGAQPGVRHSIDSPFDYLRANLAGQLVMMEVCRVMLDRPAGCNSFVYASSSSVYGANRDMPYSTTQRTDHPMSFYGATKKSCEVMAESYAHLYAIPSIGLRFFTVYGPWGRPDMSPYIFTSKILAGETIQVFNNGEMKRDFTYIDDITAGAVAALDNPPSGAAAGATHKLYNLGNNKPVALMDYIRVIENACERQALIDFRPVQPGDVLETCAEIEESSTDLGFEPKTPISIRFTPQFVSKKGLFREK